MSEAMDNFETTVVACSREALTKALSLVQMQHSRFSGFRVNNGALELFWSVLPSSGIEPREKQTPVQAFIVPLDHVAVLESVIQWLATVEPKDVVLNLYGHFTGNDSWHKLISLEERYIMLVL